MHPPRPSWASTLRLPRSAFPPRALPEDRLKYLKRCTDDLYAWQRTAPAAKSTFTLHDGPPYANGSLHIGHALNKILKDITCRVQVSQGRRVDYVPGWDCHGLPIELKALQRPKVKGQIDNASQLGAMAIRRAARQLAQDTVEEQKEGFRQWAVMGDWDNAWKTMDKDFEIRQLEVFKRMLARRLIYLKNKPVYWSPSSKTALAEAELEYDPEHESTAAYVKFPLVKLPSQIEAAAAGDQVYAVVWTTTPWTLLANKAIAVHRDLDYCLVRSHKHGLLIVGKDRLEEISRICGEDIMPSITTLNGSDLLSTTYRQPAMEAGTSLQPIFHGDFVSSSSGSGLVHIAPGHGMDDYKLCIEKGIEPFAPVDHQGRFTSKAYPLNPELFEGKEVLREGNSAVLDLLAKADAVIISNKYKHNYPCDWRSKQPVIIRATEQWFADVGQIRDVALRALENVSFVPAGGKERLSSFLQTRSEWCISRQRAWGVPIPALYSTESGAAVMNESTVEHIIKVMTERGVDAWWTDKETDSAWVPQALRKSKYIRGRDTMDVWFDSGTSWTHMSKVSKARENQDQTADMYIEGTDQHRGWFQSSLLTSIAFQHANTARRAPFKTLVTHGFTLDYEGKKMSKSLGNVISPHEIMQGTLLPPMKPKKVKGQEPKNLPTKYDGMGADALRLWVAGCDYTKDVVIGKPALMAVNQSLAKLRVTFKLLTGLLDTHSPDRVTAFADLGLIDQMALLALQDLDKIVTESYSAYEYHRGVAAISHYINAEFSAVYMESIKDRMYADATKSASRVDAQIVLWEIFKRLTHMLSPITPLLVEEACDYLPEQLRYFHPVRSAWDTQNAPSVIGPWQNVWLEKNRPVLDAINAAVKTAQEQARSEKKMGSSLQSFVSIALSYEHPLLEDQGDIGDGRSPFSSMLEDLFVVSRVYLGPDKRHNAPSGAAWSYFADCEAMGHEATVNVYEPQCKKCVRCWQYHACDEEFEQDVCQRCVGVIAGLDGAAEQVFEGSENLLGMAESFRLGNASRVLKRRWDMEYPED